jgi:NADPH-dependent 2,4-dienoyl-CoA reductase/sulfur reductase-like enzyme
MTGGKQPVSASAIESIEPGVICRALEIDEIDEIVEQFSEGARRAKIAGFDAVNILGACGYLINQFLSPLYNKRTDEYGGSWGNRIRFAWRIVRRIKERMGEDFPVIFELPADEFIEGGITLEESKIIAQKLEQAGVDAFRTQRASLERHEYITAPACLPRGFMVAHAQALKRVLKKAKVWVEGRIDPELAEEILQANKADLIGFGRAFLVDSEWPQKVANGRSGDIRKCLACNRCIERMFMNLHIRCTQNAALGKEEEYRLVPAEKAKEVVIVGGGAAGMEAARVAALRGHKVTLFEKDKKLGGQLNLACIAPYKEEMRNAIEYLTRQVKKLGVDIRLGEEVTLGKIEVMKPQVVIVATGAVPFVPEIPGVDKKNVVLAWDVLSSRREVGDRLVVAGGGMVGCEVAEFLVSKGKKVTILEMLPDIACDIEPYARIFLMERFDKYGIEILTKAKLEEITDNGVIYSENSAKKTIEADTVVLALGAVPNGDLAVAIKGKVPEVHSVGDCVKPGKLLEATHAGFHVARLM